MTHILMNIVVLCSQCCVHGVVFVECVPHMMLFISACPTNCESCYWDSTAKCLMSGCKQGFARKADGTCVGECVSTHTMETYLLCIRMCMHVYIHACMYACMHVCVHMSSHLCQYNNRRS